MFSNDLTVYETVKFSATVFPDTANTPFSLFDFAPMVAKIAAHPVFSHGFIKHSLLHNIVPISVCSCVAFLLFGWCFRTTSCSSIVGHLDLKKGSKIMFNLFVDFTSLYSSFSKGSFSSHSLHKNP